MTGIKGEFWLAYLLASRPRPYFWSNVTDLVIRWYRRRASQPLTCFWIMIPQAFSLSERNFSRYATCPARKKIFVLPNLYLSGSWEVKVENESKMKNIIMKRKVKEKQNILWCIVSQFTNFLRFTIWYRLFFFINY